MKGRKSLYLPADLCERKEQFCTPRADLRIEAWSGEERSGGDTQNQCYTQRLQLLY